MKITIVGLGLIGGSVARRIRGFNGAFVNAVDKNEISLHLAKSDGVISEGFTSGKDALADSDFIILCLYPKANVDFIKENLQYIKDGAVITDVSGVKGYVIDEINALLPDTIDFVGAHPMAGREVGGYQSSTDTLFDKASFIITPTERNKPESISLVREFARYIGCAHIVTTSPKEHDEIIAYTSQLMHVMAVALCDNPMIERSTFFSAGSLRDCTRVAVINEVMWSELFLENKNALKKRIAEMCQSLQKISDALENDDRAALEAIMKHATEQKMKWLME